MRSKVIDVVWLLVVLTGSGLWCIGSADRLGLTFDEPTYLHNGLLHWQTGSYKGLMRLGTMPLAIDVQTLSLWLEQPPEGWRLDRAADAHVAARLARRGTLVFWVLLLVSSYFVGRRLAGPWGGRWAVILIATEPTLLAHASLATTDIALAACALLLGLCFEWGRDRGWFCRVGLSGACYGAAILAKASGLVFGPMVMIAIGFPRFCAAWPTGGWSQLRPSDLAPTAWQSLRPFVRDVAQIVALGLLVTFVYCGSDWQPEPTFITWADSLPEGWQRSTMSWLARHLCIFTNAGEGLAQQIKHNLRGHGTYLLERTWPRAIWYYFPVVLSMKMTAGLLVLATILVLARPAVLTQWVFVAVMMLLLFSLGSRVQIGIRLYLPLLVLVAIGTGAGWASVMTRSETTRAHWIAALLTVALGANLIAVGKSFPDGIGFVNRFWGGPDRAYRLVSDSNLDWGQGLPQLVAWNSAAGAEPLDVWYFGHDPLVTEAPLRPLPLHSMPIESATDVAGQVAGRRLAASATLVYGAYAVKGPAGQAAAYLRTQKPKWRLGPFLIYDFSSEPGPRIADDRR